MLKRAHILQVFNIMPVYCEIFICNTQYFPNAPMQKTLIFFMEHLVTDTGFSWDTLWEEMLWDHLPPSSLRKKWTVEKSGPEIHWKVTEKTLSFSPILNYHHLCLWDCLQERSPVLRVILSSSHRNSTNHSFYCAGHQKINKKKQKICICDS